MASAARSPVQAPFEGVLKVDYDNVDLPVEILNGWFPRELGWSVDYLIETAEVIHGINLMSLRHTMIWKEYLQRSKDVDDIKMIKRYLLANHG